MRTIVRRADGASYQKYLKKLARAEGIKNPTPQDLGRMDRKRKGKKVSNKEWKSPSDPDARITKMKDGTTHLAHKAEHAVDLESGVIVAAEIHPADSGDTTTLPETLKHAQAAVERANPDLSIEEIVADCGYHSVQTLGDLDRQGYMTCIPGTPIEGKTPMEAPGPRGRHRRGAPSPTSFLREPPQTQEPARQEAARQTRSNDREKFCPRMRDRRAATTSSAWKAKHLQAVPAPRRRYQPRDTSAQADRNRNAQRIAGKEGPSLRSPSCHILHAAVLSRSPETSTRDLPHPRPTALGCLPTFAAQRVQPISMFIHGLLEAANGFREERRHAV